MSYTTRLAFYSFTHKYCILQSNPRIGKLQRKVGLRWTFDLSLDWLIPPTKGQKFFSCHRFARRWSSSKPSLHLPKQTVLRGGGLEVPRESRSCFMTCTQPRFRKNYDTERYSVKGTERNLSNDRTTEKESRYQLWNTVLSLGDELKAAPWLKHGPICLDEYMMTIYIYIYIMLYIYIVYMYYHVLP